MRETARKIFDKCQYVKVQYIDKQILPKNFDKNTFEMRFYTQHKIWKAKSMIELKKRTYS